MRLDIIPALTRFLLRHQNSVNISLIKFTFAVRKVRKETLWRVNIDKDLNATIAEQIKALPAWASSS